MFTFFMKTQDNNYVVVENLRELLKAMNPNEPLLIGRLMKVFIVLLEPLIWCY